MAADTQYFDEEMETLSRDRLLDLQWQRLLARLAYLEENSPFYQRKFRESGLKVGEVKNRNDFHRLVPFTDKDEVKAERERTGEAFAGLLCVPQEEIVHLIRTGGTTGLPTMYGMTEKDIQGLGRLAARLWYQIGARRGHVVPVGTFGVWNAFSLALLEGHRTAGLTKYHFSMPAPGEEIFPLEILPRWMKVRGLYLSPRPVRQVTEKYGSRIKELVPDLEYIMMAGQRVTSSFRRGIESRWGGRLFEAYAMTDAGMPTCNCTAQTDTFHLHEDAFLLEVIDPETGEDLSGTGRVGEIAVTPLLWEGTPLFRFNSGDVGYTLTDPCPCGRTGARLGVTERAAHAVRVGERLVYSFEVEEIIYGYDELFLKHYHLVKKQVQPQPRLLIRLEPPDDGTAAERIKQEIKARVSEELGVEAEIEYLAEDDERFVAAYKFLRVVEE